MDISILLPIHKIDEFLSFSLNSISSEMNNCAELIIILNGDAISKRQEILNLLNALPKMKIRILQSFETGIVPALNLGIDAADGKYIARMDHDDLMLSGRLKRQFDFLESHENVGILGTDVIEICEHNFKVKQWFVKNKISHIPWKPVYPELAHPSVMIRTTLIRSLGGYREIFNNVEDHDLWLRAMEHTNIRNLSFVGLAYRRHQNQISRINSMEQQLNTFRIYLYNELPEFKKTLHTVSNLKLCVKYSDFKQFLDTIDEFRFVNLIRLKLALRYWRFLSELQNKDIGWGIRNLLWVVFYFAQNKSNMIHRLKNKENKCNQCASQEVL